MSEPLGSSPRTNLIRHHKRVAKALGYRRILTSTLAPQRGDSLRAAGWAETDGGSRSRGACVRRDAHPIGPKRRWIATITNASPA
jgi:hypothetical protein